MIKRIIFLSFVAFKVYGIPSSIIILSKIGQNFVVEFNGKKILSEHRDDDAFGLGNIDFFHDRSTLYVLDFKENILKKICLVDNSAVEYSVNIDEHFLKRLRNQY